MMAPEQILVANLNAALLVVLALGLMLTRRYRLSRFFAAYVVAVLVGNRLVAIWPGAFFTASFWTVKEAAYAGLKLGIAIELGVLTFSEFPRGRRIFLAVVGATVALVLWITLAPARLLPGDAIAWVSAAVTRGQAGILCILTATIVLAAYYRVPFHPFHRGVLLGFALYLVAYTGSVALLRQIGAPGYGYYSALDPSAYAASVGVWTWSAWRSLPEMGPELRRLQPWAVRTI